MLNAPLNILMITKWYPYEQDPQLGVFIQKHARAIAMFNRVELVYAYSDEHCTSNFRHRKVVNGNLTEHFVAFKKDTSPLAKLLNAQRYKNAVESAVSIIMESGFRPDIVHGYILLRAGWMARDIAQRLKIPYVISEQWSGYATGKFKEKNIVARNITSKVINESAGITVVSDFLKKSMNNNGLTHRVTEVIPNMIEFTGDEVPPNKQHSDKSILMVADQVDSIKNISAVIRAAGELSLTRNDFELRIIGNGVDHEKLKSLAKELDLLDAVVFFEGMKTNEEVYDYLRQCDFLVMNSRFETFSLICCEAMSCGKPVLATRCGGPESFVTKENGILIDVDDNESLKKEINFLLDHFHEFDADTIQKTVINKYSAATIGRQFDQFYRSLYTAN